MYNVGIGAKDLALKIRAMLDLEIQVTKEIIKA